MYRYNESRFLEALYLMKQKYNLSEGICNYLLLSAKNHHEDWNDNLRQISDNIKEQNLFYHYEFINFASSQSKETWADIMTFVDDFLFQGDLWSDIFHNSSDECRDYYFSTT